MTRVWHNSFAATLLAGVALCLPASCSSAKPRLRAPRLPICELDQAREYHCEALLPRASSRPAPEPFESCPSYLEHPEATLGPSPSTAPFDVDYTRYTRKRVPPGHSCCFSWCATLEVPDPRQIDPAARCAGDLAFREELCFEALESGTSIPAREPFGVCPAAVIPPPAGVFFQPKEGALFDSTLTTKRRSEGFDHCCYAWCSQAPQGVAGRELPKQ